MNPKIRLSRLAVNAILVVFSIALVMFVMEVIMRAGESRKRGTPRESPASDYLACEHDSLLGWIFPPNTRGSYASGRYLTHVRTNSWGIRNAEIDTGDTARIRILVLGDSYAFGWGISEDDAFPCVLERMLKDAHRDIAIEVINAAIPGYGVYQQNRMFEYIRSRVRVDIVVATFSMANDPIDDLRIAKYMPDRLVEYSPEIRDPRSLLSRMIDGSRLLTFVDHRTRGLQFSTKNIGSASLEEARRAMEKLIVSCEEHGAFLVIGIVPRRSEIARGNTIRRWMVRRLMKKLKGLVQVVSRDHGVPAVDLHDVLLEVEEGDGAYLEGDVHWSLAGHRAVAEAFLRALPQSWLEKRNEARSAAGGADGAHTL